ncbi:MAG: CPBP family intramembrane metalloprotease [Chitinophagaceae bacterium]|jgi:hypothetical protein|nr:CPBP family intramembrane metalloprotease [Chitinophagaceae bacterium]
MENELKSFWRRFFRYDWKFGMVLLVLVCVPRFLLVLNANATGSYGAIGIIMIVSALAPFLFLSREGRIKSGIVAPRNTQGLLLAFIAGLAASIVLYLVGEYLYGGTSQNWYAYIGKSYKIPSDISPGDRQVLFAVMAITGMTFSPVGEEFFFRGIVHSSVAASLGEKKASLADGSAFAITHIAHFGLVFVNDRWRFYVLPTILWVISMFLISLLFYFFRKHTCSIWGAVSCHAAFNLGMIFCIFYLI